MRNIGTSGLSALTLDQINNLDDTEFTDCIDILGAVTDYSDAQKQALADVGKRNTVSRYVCYLLVLIVYLPLMSFVISAYLKYKRLQSPFKSWNGN